MTVARAQQNHHLIHLLPDCSKRNCVRDNFFDNQSTVKRVAESNFRKGTHRSVTLKLKLRACVVVKTAKAFNT